MTRNPPSFSVIIPTYNRAESLGNCLQALSSLHYSRESFDVLIVDDGGSQALEPVVDPFRDRLFIRLLKCANGGPAAARNMGAAAAKREWLVFLDDDCTPQPEWLRAFAAGAGDANEILGGVTVNSLSANPYSTASHLLVEYVCRYFLSRRSALSFFTSNNLALRAAHFHEMGGFDSRFRRAAAEDRELCYRWIQAGRELRVVPGAIVQHAHRLDFISFWRQHFGYGAGAFTFRSLSTRRSGARIPAERLSFYAGLIRFPFQPKRGPNPLRLSLLLLISQLAHTLGFLYGAASSNNKGAFASTPVVAAKGCQER